MNTLQRLLSNTLLAFASNLTVKASNSLLFILIGRMLGPTNAGIFNLGITYYTVVFALSAWGLHELLVRELAPRREESRRYLVNYLLIRLTLAVVTYGALLLLLYIILPYNPTTKQAIHILALAVFPEATFSILGAFFEARENLFPPTLTAFASSVIKLGGGGWMLILELPVTQIAWIVPLGSSISLLLFIPFLWRVWRDASEASGKVDLPFIRSQLRHTPSFVVLHLFSLLDYQTDAFLISLFLTETHVGWYGAAQTLLLAFWMLPIAVRTAIYPLMARFHQTDRDKLLIFYHKTNQYLFIGILPVVTVAFVLAPQLITLIFDTSFAPAIPVLRWTIWSIVFALLNVPNARLMIVANKQRAASWLTGLSMLINVVLNLLLIPRFEIVGAAMARLAASFSFFLLIYGYVQLNILRSGIVSFWGRPLLAAAVMGVVIWQVHPFGLFLSLPAGLISYILACLLLKVIPAEDRVYWQTLFRS